MIMPASSKEVEGFTRDLQSALNPEDFSLIRK